MSGFSAPKAFRFSLIFLIFYFLLYTIFPPTPKETSEDTSPVLTSIKSQDKKYAQGQLVSFDIQNKNSEDITTKISLETRENGEWKSLPLENNTITISGEKSTITSFSDQNQKLFHEPREYRATLRSADQHAFLSEDQFLVSEPGFFRTVWQAFFFKPLYNLLIFLTFVFQQYFVLAVIALTLIVKCILLIPSKKGILAQQKMQKVQPELEALKKKYKEDPQKQAQEMMGLWKKHGVNPGSALLPTLIQFPVLIALFFVIKDGFLPHNTFLLYENSFLESITSLPILFQAFWLDLRIPDPLYIIPLSVGALQFWQMMSMNRKKEEQKKKDQKKKKGRSEGEHKENPQQQIMRIMMYVLPVIVVVFCATLPAAVGVYWGVSTLFAIVQQKVLQQ